MISRIGVEKTADQEKGKRGEGDGNIEIVPVTRTSIVEPVASVKDLLERWWKPLQDIKEKLLENNDLLSLPGRDHPYIKKSGYRKYATAFGLSDEIIWQECERNPDNKDEFTWRIRVRVTAPNGRFAEAVGAASTKERKFAHPEHDIFAMAHTRAKSRGISDLVGGGADVAEDLEGQEDVQDRRSTGAPKGAQGTATKGSREQQNNTSKQGSVGGSAPSSPTQARQEQPRSANFSEPYGADCPKCKKPLTYIHSASGNTFIRCDNCGVIDPAKAPPRPTDQSKTG